MAITIVAENIEDARDKLGLREPQSAIRIKWRRPEMYYSDRHDTGCVVDASGVSGEEVPRSFPSSADALRYIAGILKKHDAYAKEQKAKHEKEMRDLARKQKKCKSDR